MANTNNQYPSMNGVNRMMKILQKNGSTERFRRLTRRHAFFDGTQYDHLLFDYDGYNVNTLHSPVAVESTDYVKMKFRRPSLQTGIPAKIVNAFTTLLFGHGMKPAIVSQKDDGKTDDDATAFIGQLTKDAKLFKQMLLARTLGGSMGGVAILPTINKGKPGLKVLDIRNMMVFEWEDYDNQIPAVVVQQYRIEREKFEDDGSTKEQIKWIRRKFDQQHETLWESSWLDSLEADPDWQLIDEVEHGLSRCPIIWIKNWPESDGSQDGQADYPDRMHSDFERLDYLISQMDRAFFANLDPTPVFSGINPNQVLKGSDNGINLPNGADAKYLEASFAGAEAGKEHIDKHEGRLQAECQCVILDAQTVVGTPPSGEAIKKLLAPMHSRAEAFRDIYGDAIIQAVTLLVEIASNAKEKLKLSRKVKVVEAGNLELQWPDFVIPTPEDIGKMAQGIATARAGKFISQQASVRYFAPVVGVEDCEAEIKQLASELLAEERRFEDRMLEDDTDNE